MLPVLDGSGGSGTAAARELRTLASVAAQQPDAQLAPGMFAYTRSEAMWMSTSASADGSATATTLSEPFTREIWIGVDGSGRIRETTGDPSQPLATVPSPDHNWDASFEAGELTLPLNMWDFTPERLERLADDPAALAEAIRTRADTHAQPVAYESFVIVGDLLREAVAPAAVRAALFEVAAGIPGVELVGVVEDLAGRTGTAVAYTHDGVRSELIFDPETSMLLAERDTVVAPVDHIPFPAGTVIGYATYLDAGIVPSTAVTP